ncbi:MAG: CBS domain-containing protein [Bacteroidetes bacterium]|nr:MAG: CBS domain-containing protein [Bacteroidota bacterium]
MTATHTAELTDLLRDVPPFSGLPEATHPELLQRCERQEHPAGTILYRQDTTALHHICLIAEGEVEKYVQGESGEKTFAETFGRGEVFGALSIMLQSERALRTVCTTQATVIYRWPRETFLDLLDRYPAFQEYFADQFGRRLLKGGYVNMLMRRPDPATNFQQADLAFTQEVRAFVNPQVNTIAASASIREAAKSMTYFRRGYVLVVNPEHEPLGIVTDWDLREKVVAAGRDPESPVSSIMSAPLLDIAASAHSYEAILLMFRYKVNHLLVRDAQGRLTGLVTLDQLLNAQGKSPFIFIQSIADVYDTEGLRRKWEEMPQIVDTLQGRGTRPVIVNQIISTVADAIAQNIVRRTIKRLGPPPARFVFVALGSEGRKEQTLATDQDNAIIYEAVPEAQAETVAAYFLELGTQVCDELNTAGFAYCHGNLMAKNPEWNQPLPVWREKYRNWLEAPVPEHVMTAATFFDCRTLYGDTYLLDTLRAHFLDILGRQGQGFLAQLSRAALLNKPPLGFFGGFQLTESEDKKGVNIKRAMSTISDFARIYALRHHLWATHTGDRLRELRQREVLDPEDHNELRQAYYFMMRLRLAHQTRQIVEGLPPDNLIDPNQLTKIERVTLREIFKVIEKYQKRLAIAFMGTLG